MSPLPMTKISIDLEVHRMIEAGRVSFDETPNAILRRLFHIDTTSRAAESRGKKSETSKEDGSPDLIKMPVNKRRRTGSYEFVLQGIRHKENSLRDAYKACLLELASLDSNFLDRLSLVETRSRRIVARDPKDLFKNSPELASKFSAPLKGEWWFDINLSQLQVEQRLKLACKEANISYGIDLKLDFPR